MTITGDELMALVVSRKRLQEMVADLRASVLLAMVLAGDDENWITWKHQAYAILSKHGLEPLAVDPSLNEGGR